MLIQLARFVQRSNQPPFGLTLTCPTYTIPHVPSLIASNTANETSTDLRGWARKLNHWGLAGITAALLESGSAFAMLASQSLYASQPLIETWIPRNKVNALAKMLEDPNRTSEFVAALRQEQQ